MLTPELRQRLSLRRASAAEASRRFHEEHGSVLGEHRLAIEQSMRDSIARFEQVVAQLSDRNPLAVDLAARTADYVAWMQWALGDLPYYSVALGLTPSKLPPVLGPCILTYFSGRVFDDFLDRHFLYRGRRDTLLSSLGDDALPGGLPDAFTVLMGLLLLIDALHQIASDSPDSGRLTRQMLGNYRGVLLGTVMDRSSPELWSASFYERLVLHKNVDYWLLLYDALDPEHRSPLHPILLRYHALAQKLNDLEDYTRDESLGVANIVSVYRRHFGEVEGGTLRAVEERVAEEILDVWSESDALPEPARSVVSLKLNENCDLLINLGLLGALVDTPAPPTPMRLNLAFYSNQDEFLQRLGPDALEHVACPVCGSEKSGSLFRKQGFLFHDCRSCTHIYVSPRLRRRFLAQLAAEAADTEHDVLLELRPGQAEQLCRTLHQHSSRPRLLDAACDGGELLFAAQAIGFQVYGLHRRPPAEHVQASFADRLQACDLERDPVPWGNFDHILLRHALEHLLEPGAALRRILAALNPGGLLYVAVPSSDAVQWKLLGKNWDAVMPLAHPNFYSEASLRRLLLDTGFEVVERIVAAPPPRPQRWMRLFRSLGGDETGELALLARRPLAPTGTHLENLGSQEQTSRFPAADLD